MHDLYIAHVYVDPWHCLFVALFLFASTHRAPKTAIPLRCRVTVVQGHSRSSKLVSNESPRATSYWFSCLRFRDMTYSSKIYGFSLFTPPQYPLKPSQLHGSPWTYGMKVGRRVSGLRTRLENRMILRLLVLTFFTSV